MKLGDQNNGMVFPGSWRVRDTPVGWEERWDREDAGLPRPVSGGCVDVDDLPAGYGGEDGEEW